MVERTDKTEVEITCGELFDMVNALLCKAEILIASHAPTKLCRHLVELAEKNNKVLKDVGYDYFEDWIFTNKKERIERNESIQQTENDGPY